MSRMTQEAFATDLRLAELRKLAEEADEAERLHPGTAADIDSTCALNNALRPAAVLSLCSEIDRLLALLREMERHYGYFGDMPFRFPKDHLHTRVRDAIGAPHE